MSAQSESFDVAVVGGGAIGLAAAVRAAFCCAQAPFNEGMREPAVDLARRFLQVCEPGIPTVIPSGSCTSMVKVFYSDLLAEEPALGGLKSDPRFKTVAARYAAYLAQERQETARALKLSA